MGKNKVRFGFSNVVMSVITESVAQDGTITYSYGTPFPVPGAVNFNPSPSGDSNEFKADNMTYFQDLANNGYEGDLEMAKFPEAVHTNILGRTLDNNGALSESKDDVTKRFALGFQMEGDVNGTRAWFYDCSVTSRPSLEASTIENAKEPKTQSMGIKCNPRKSDGKTLVSLEKSTENATVYNSFLSEVYEQNTQG